MEERAKATVEGTSADAPEVIVGNLVKQVKCNLDILHSLTVGLILTRVVLKTTKYCI